MCPPVGLSSQWDLTYKKIQKIEKLYNVVCYQEKKKDANDDSADATNPVGEPAGLEVDPKSIIDYFLCLPA